ncbi:hypothetical protein AMTR_s00068p00136370 [Amborella trichopoda]|uniref:Uncharacterized protein n=1 Tax=Amborella trichopoda TaxID=13333 RepID=U5D4C5_AMBTC|nr:hypothetical protein AMTR_s00068p00136370 [Amborella trichopoda]
MKFLISINPLANNCDIRILPHPLPPSICLKHRAILLKPSFTWARRLPTMGLSSSGPAIPQPNPGNPPQINSINGVMEVSVAKQSKSRSDNLVQINCLNLVDNGTNSETCTSVKVD